MGGDEWREGCGAEVSVVGPLEVSCFLPRDVDFVNCKLPNVHYEVFL